MKRKSNPMLAIDHNHGDIGQIPTSMIELLILCNRKTQTEKHIEFWSHEAANSWLIFL